MATLLAKSQGQGGLTLLEHTMHVTAVAERLAQTLGFDTERARQGAILHDLGKAHPAFQAMLLESLTSGEIDETLHDAPWSDAVRRELMRRKSKRNGPHRHELSSLLLLPLFPEAAWPDLVDMVVAHHKSISGDAARRGLFDLIEYDGEDGVFERHSEAWDAWSPAAITIAAGFDLEPHPVSLREAKTAFIAAAEHCQRKPKGWSRWRGLLMGADHFASAYTHHSDQASRALFTIPDLSFYEQRTRTPSASRYPLAAVPADTPHPHTLVVAPTGAGKTDYLLRRCRGRVFYTLPFQASINAMYLRVRKDLEHSNASACDVRRLHAASQVELGGDHEEEVELQRHPGASVKVMTPHQIAAIAFGTPGHETIALDLEGQDIILDEVHTYDALARAMVVQIVRVLVRLRCRVHIGSATIPEALANALVDALGGSEHVHHVVFPNEVLDTFDRHTVHRCADEEAARDALRAAIKEGRRMLFVSNRVDWAQERFRWAREEFPDIPSMLIHSRFRRRDRAVLEKAIRQFEKKPGPCLVCATQVIEVSLDISFDGMITDAAPLDALIQRFGRVNRRRPENSAEQVLMPVHVIAPPANDAALKPYRADVVRRSYDALPKDGQTIRERDLQTLIDRVYPDVEIPDVAIHFVMNEEGGYALRELENRDRSVIVDALEIESATCVLKSDREAYIRAGWNERPELEIPSPQHVHRFAERWGQIERGSYPVLVPDEHYDPCGVPLGLVLPKTAEPDDLSHNRML